MLVLPCERVSQVAIQAFVECPEYPVLILNRFRQALCFLFVLLNNDAVLF